MRLCLYFVLFISLIGIMGLSCFGTWQKILNNKREKERLDNVYTSLLKDETNLEDDVKKLQDPEYVAKYAREKYLYTKEGEYVIDLSDLKK
jgi:septum formation initiator